MPKLFVLRHNPQDTIDSFNHIFHKNGLTEVMIDAYPKFDYSGTSEGIESVIMLGGAVGQCKISSQEYQFVERILKDKIPFIGLCLGAQILSEILGGKIYPNSEPEIGWIKLDILNVESTHPIQHFAGQRTRVLSWHQDTCDVPKEARLLASTPVCLNQAFEYQNAIGLQFHIEVPVHPFETWFASRKEELSTHIPDIELFRKETDANLPQYHTAVNDFIRSWLTRRLKS